MADRAWDSDETIITQMPHSALSFDNEAFDAFIHSQGVKLEHYESLRCPVGMVDTNDNRRPTHDHSGCSNGFLFTYRGTITGWMSGNSKNQKLEDIGYVNGASCFATFPRYYDPNSCKADDRQFYGAPFDRFYLAEKSIVVPTWQTHVISGNGKDRLAFPAVFVDRLIDFRGVSYVCGQDFDLDSNGQIVWRPDRQPVPDEGSGKAVISVRYRYRPFWYIARYQHEIRVSQEPLDDQRELVRGPQQCILNREYLFLDSQNLGPDHSSADEIRRGGGTAPAETLRQNFAPQAPSFEPR
jgi:hypothetical protein